MAEILEGNREAVGGVRTETVEWIPNGICRCPKCRSLMPVFYSMMYLRCINPLCQDGASDSPPKYRLPKLTLEVIDDDARGECEV